MTPWQGARPEAFTDPLVTAIRLRCYDLLRPVGAQPTRTLGTANAVFPGGITLITPSGEVRVLAPAISVWVWPAIILGVWAFLAVALALAVDGPQWIALVLVGLFSVLLWPVAVVALVLGRQARRRRLAIDARQRTFDEVLAERIMLSVPARLVQAIRVQHFENSDNEDMFDILVNLGFAELWVHQERDGAAAQTLAQTIAAALNVQVDATG